LDIRTTKVFAKAGLENNIGYVQASAAVRARRSMFSFYF